MRRLLLPGMAAVLLLCGCGAEQPDATPAAGASSSPTPAPSAQPIRQPKPSAPPPAADLSGALAGFPLAYGLDEENGNDHSPVTVTAKPATHAFDSCGVPTWDPRSGTTDVIGVEFRGEGEWAIGRTLVLYADAATATTAMVTAHDAIAGCPDEPRGDQQGSSHTIVDTVLGDQSLVWTDTFYSVQDAAQQDDTGLVVFELVRVGRAVLLTYEYGEGNASPDSREQAVLDATQQNQTLVRRMQDVPATDPPTGSEIPDDFPLDTGITRDADTTVHGPGRDVPGVYVVNLCHSTAWPGPADTRTDRLAVVASGPEWGIDRELVTFDSEDHAAAVVAQLRYDAIHCQSAEGQAVTRYNAPTGEDSVTYGTSYDEGLGGTLVQVVRRGRAVLAVSQTAEYSPESMADAVPALTRDNVALIQLMGCSDGEGGCDPVGDAFTLTAQGGAPFRLGMTVEEARRAADHVRIDGGTFCPQLSWTDPSGVHVHGAFSPGIGLAYLSIDGGGTTEGVAVGGTLDNLRAAYPNLAHADNGLWYADVGATTYNFEVNKAHVIDWMLVTVDDQQCAG